MKATEAKAALLAKIASHGWEKLPADQAALLESFIGQFYAHVDPGDLLDRSLEDLYGAALSSWNVARERQPGEAKVLVYAPNVEEHGWQSTHSVLEIVSDDMPFLVDSVSMELARHGSAIHLAIHPVIRVRRDAEGQIEELFSSEGGSGDGEAESIMHVEIDRRREPELVDALTADLHRVLADVRAVVEDWPAMRERASKVARELDEEAAVVDPGERAEAKALLEWMRDDHFTFLGYRVYVLLEEEGEDVLRAVPDSGLGILREKGEGPISHSFAELPPEVRALARSKTLLNLTKANSRATVHRPSYLDYVGVKRFDADGEVSGEIRFLGLYTHTAYSASPWDIPVLRRKVQGVLDRAGFVPGSHDEKALIDILETYPRDELFQISEDELHDIALGILYLGERQLVRLFVRRDTFGRFLSCLVYLPRERYNTDTRRRIEAILQEAFAGTSVEHSARVSESVSARLHFVIYTEAGQVPDYDVREIEARLAQVTRSWTDDLRDALIEQLGEERGSVLDRRFGDAFPAAYREDFSAQAAVSDVEQLESLAPDGDLGVSLWQPPEAARSVFHLKLFCTGAPIVLSDVLPLLENMGLRVIDERPYEIRRQEREPSWIFDFGLSYDVDGQLESGRVKEIFHDAFARVFHGEIEDDGFNQLVPRAGLTAREITVLRAVCKYLRQTGTTFSQPYMEETLAANPRIARLLVELFQARFDPAVAGTDKAETEAARLTGELEEAIESVASLDEDRILRSFLRVVAATLRTNYFQRQADGQPKPYLSLKLDPERIPDLPAPRPKYEVFVYSPRMEGLHLRAGKVARGGIRWSDRREDFRTEILGLMKAQTVKNAVIVPVGAKGGFVVKQPPDGDREALQQEVVACYETLICGLLDLTDNIVEGAIVTPPDIVRYDDEDPYLVVAADKGTATFSDIANAVSQQYGFWLGDAFASGGSTGYDHKAMGITARGAWESVKRHFRELGITLDDTEFTVVGIGDMSGDVFGNGLQQSPLAKLVGAFDHRHVFLDPDPDPARSFSERERLFRLPGSSWADYDETLISEGGGVFPRTAKSIALSPQARAVLGVEVESLTPNELIRALLRAPVDLIWNGGIGTFVKAASESHADVGDRTSDAIRVDAEELRSRAVGEGGNLGFTQRARVAYALRDGRVYMDALDNSAGVDCSDHEVNIKILLDRIVSAGSLSQKQRNALLAEMTAEVAALVLRDNYEQTQAISLSVAQAPSMVDVHARYLRHLEAAGKLDRHLECLPSEEDLSERKAAGRGLTAPEFAVLLAYTKIVLAEESLASDLPEDPHLAVELERYFPAPLRESFRAEMQEHPLRREIVVSQLVNGMVDRAGTTFAFRLGEETGATAPDVVRAFTVAREAFSLDTLWAEIEKLDDRIPAQTQLALLLTTRVLLERATRWLLRNRPRPLDIGATVAHFRPGATTLAELVPKLLPPADGEACRRAAQDLAAAGVPPELASRVAHLEALLPALDIVETATETGQTPEAVAEAYFALGAWLDLSWVRDRIAGLPREERWDALARRSLLDDLYDEQRTLTAEVLKTDTAALPAAERVGAWASANVAPVERCLQVLAEVKAGAAPDLATLFVAVRELRNLIQAATASAESAAETQELHESLRRRVSRLSSRER